MTTAKSQIYLAMVLWFPPPSFNSIHLITFDLRCIFEGNPHKWDAEHIDKGHQDQ